MTPADKRELCAILRRVLIAPDWWTALDAIEKEEPCPTPTSETSGATSVRETDGTSKRIAETEGPRRSNASGATEPDTAPPDLDAIRQAVERLRGAADSFVSDAEVNGIDVVDAVRSFLKLDVPAVVERLHIALATWRETAEAIDLRLIETKQRAESAEARVKELEARCNNPTSETSGASADTPRPSTTAESGRDDPSASISRAPASHTAPPDLDAIRKAFERLREAADLPTTTPSGYRYMMIAGAAERLLALDVPAVVDRLADEARVAHFDAGVFEDNRQRAEAAEARSDLAEAVRHDTERKLTAAETRAAEWMDRAMEAQVERDAARKERDAAIREVGEANRRTGEAEAKLILARDKALDDAAVRTRAQAVDYAHQQIAYDALRDLEADIRAMKGKP